MQDEPEYERIARRESRERVRRILETLATSKEPRWPEVYRDAHTFASIAPDAEMMRHARELASMVCDERGRVRPPPDIAEAHRVGRMLSEGAARLGSDEQASTRDQA